MESIKENRGFRNLRLSRWVTMQAVALLFLVPAASHAESCLAPVRPFVPSDSQATRDYADIIRRDFEVYITHIPVGAEDHGCAAIAIPIAPGLVLSCIPDIEHANGPHEIELRSTDIDVRAVLNEPEGPVGGNEIGDWQGLEWSAVVGPVQDIKDAASVV